MTVSNNVNPQKIITQDDTHTSTDTKFRKQTEESSKSNNNNKNYLKGIKS